VHLRPAEGPQLPSPLPSPLLLPFPAAATHLVPNQDISYPCCMRLSEGVEWGIHSVLVLAMLPAGDVLPASALAEFHGLSPSYLLKQLQALVRAGVLESVPGQKGGYRIGRAPEAITVLQIVEAIEGAEPAFRCTEIRQQGPCVGPPSAYVRPCAVHLVMRRADAAWRGVLAAQTVADLVRTVQHRTSARIAADATAWLGERVHSAGA
jgi:Rrf2 family protein